jgi:O-antigen ligase
MNENSRRTSFQTASALLASGTRLCFATTVILIPVRYRIVLLTRSIPPLYSDYTDFLLFAADVAMLITLALWILSLILLPRKIVLGPRHIWIPLAGLTLAGWISTISSFDAQLAAYHAIRFFALFWFYVYIVNEIRSAGWVVIPIGIQIMIQSIVALAQFIAQRSVDLQKLGELYLNPAWPGVSVVVANGVRLLRAYGLSDHPNILGGCLAFGLLIMLAAYIHIPKPFPILSALIPAFPALLVTFSRSAWLAFLGGLVFIIVVEILSHKWDSMRQLPWLALMCLFLLSPFLLAYARFFGARINADNSFNTPSVEQQSIGERFLLLNSTLPILVDHPIFGVGLGNAPIALKAYYPNFPVSYEPPHLTIIDAALETGLLGAVFYLALIFFPFVIFFRYRVSLLSNPMALTAIAILVSLTIVGFFDYYTWLLVPGRLWQWLAWGLWAVALKETFDKTKLPASSIAQNGF